METLIIYLAVGLSFSAFFSLIRGESMREFLFRLAFTEVMQIMFWAMFN